MKQQTIAARWRQHFKEDKNKLEWLIFFAGAAVMCGLVLYLIIAWNQQEDDWPQVNVECRKVKTTNGKNLYVVELQNTGNLTLEKVQLQAMQWENGGIRETVPFEVDLAPRRSINKAWLQWPDQEADSVTVRIISFQ